MPKANAKCRDLIDVGFADPSYGVFNPSKGVVHHCWGTRNQNRSEFAGIAERLVLAHAHHDNFATCCAQRRANDRVHVTRYFGQAGKDFSPNCALHEEEWLSTVHLDALTPMSPYAYRRPKFMSNNANRV